MEFVVKYNRVLGVETGRIGVPIGDSRLQPLGPNEGMLVFDERPTDGVDLDLDKVKEVLWQQVKRVRALLEDGSCNTPKGVVQCDEKSQGRLNGVIHVLREAAEAGFPVSGRKWTMSNNERVFHTPEELRRLGLAVGLFIGAVRDAAGDLRDTIQAAETLEDALKIDIAAAEWPDPMVSLVPAVAAPEPEPDAAPA